MSNFKALLAGYKAPKKVKAARPPSPPPRETEDDLLRAMMQERGPRVMQDVRREAAQKAHHVGSVDDAAGEGPAVVAVLFMLRDGLPFEEHWRLWIETAARRGLEVHVFAHSHHPEKIKSGWLKQRLIRKRFNTTWGSLDLVKVPLFVSPQSLVQLDSLRIPLFFFNICSRQH